MSYLRAICVKTLCVSGLTRVQICLVATGIMFTPFHSSLCQEVCHTVPRFVNMSKNIFACLLQTSQCFGRVVLQRMTQTEHKSLRLAPDLIRRVLHAAKEEGSTFSQFVRTAIIRELNMVERRKA